MKKVSGVKKQDTSTHARLRQLFGNVMLLDSRQVSQALGISNQTFRNWLWKKKFGLEPIRVGGPNSRAKWRLDDLANYLDHQRSPSANKLAQQQKPSGADAANRKIAEQIQSLLQMAEIDSSFMHGMPNLFPPMTRGRKKFHRGTILQSGNGVEIQFYGKQLHEEQADLWLRLIEESKPLAQRASFTLRRSKLLEELDRGDGSADHKWLHETMKELMLAMLNIEVRNSNGTLKLLLTLRLIESIDFDDVNETYTLSMNPLWHTTDD